VAAGLVRDDAPPVGHHRGHAIRCLGLAYDWNGAPRACNLHAEVDHPKWDARIVAFLLRLNHAFTDEEVISRQVKRVGGPTVRHEARNRAWMSNFNLRVLVRIRLDSFNAPSLCFSRIHALRRGQDNQDFHVNSLQYINALSSDRVAMSLTLV
jgi:hypothetical protein